MLVAPPSPVMPVVPKIAVANGRAMAVGIPEDALAGSDRPVFEP